MRVTINLVVDDDIQADSVTAAFADAVRAVRNLRNRTPFHDTETRSRLKVSADVLDAVGARYADALEAARPVPPCSEPGCPSLALVGSRHAIPGRPLCPVHGWPTVRQATGGG